MREIERIKVVKASEKLHKHPECWIESDSTVTQYLHFSYNSSYLCQTKLIIRINTCYVAMATVITVLVWGAFPDRK